VIRSFIPLLQDWFHYFLVYDPQQKTLVADRGEMGIGTAYQAQVPKTARKGRGHSTKHSICLCNTCSFQLAFFRNLLQICSEEWAR